jgi:transcription elongation factor Elf1
MTSPKVRKKRTLGCPFCGEQPELAPLNPVREGNAWGMVLCTNADCPADVSVRDGIDVCDERGSDAYKAAAIKLWNKRATLTLSTPRRGKK